MAQDGDHQRQQQDNLSNLAEDSLDRALRAILYRQDCPDKMALGDYALGLLSGIDQARIQRHLKQCLHCQAELARFSQSLADDELLAALNVAPDPAPMTAPDPTWVEQLFEAGRAWLEQETGRWRQVSLTLAKLGSQQGTAPALTGLMSEALQSVPAQDSLLVAPAGADFELALTISPDPAAGSADFCQLLLMLTLLDRFGDFSGAQVTLQWGNQVHSQETNALGEALFAGLPCAQLDQMNLTITLPE